MHSSFCVTFKTDDFVLYLAKFLVKLVSLVKGLPFLTLRCGRFFSKCYKGVLDLFVTSWLVIGK